MADTNHKNDFEALDSLDLTAISLLAFDSADLTAAASLLALNSSIQPISVDQEMRSNIPETSLPIKKCLDSPGSGQFRGSNSLSSKESIRHSYVPRPASRGENSILVGEKASYNFFIYDLFPTIWMDGCRKLDPESCCFIRELSKIDSDHDVGRLYLTRDEAETIPSCPQMTEVPKNTRKIATLMVFDYRDVLWNMILNCYRYEANILYLLRVDEWRKFLRANKLGPGDTIFLYKNRDSRISADGYYYVMLFWKASDGGFKSFLDLPCKKTSRKEK